MPTGNSVKNQINLRTIATQIDEAYAGAALNPGHLIQLESDGTVIKHATPGGSNVLIARSDTLIGQLVTGSFAQGDTVYYNVPVPGDRYQVRIPAGAAAILKGDKLVSDGLGRLVKATFLPGTLLSAVAASAAITASSTETKFDNSSFTIPANMLRAGDVIRVRAQVIATATNSTDTLTIKAYIGGTSGTAIVTTGAVDVADGAIGYIEFDLVIRTIGSTGTLVAAGTQGLGAVGTVTAKPFLLASTAIDTTASKELCLSGQWSTTSGGNSCRLDVVNYQLIRAGAGGTSLFQAAESLDNSAGGSEAFIIAMAV